MFTVSEIYEDDKISSQGVAANCLHVLSHVVFEQAVPRPEERAVYFTNIVYLELEYVLFILIDKKSL